MLARISAVLLVPSASRGGQVRHLWDAAGQRRPLVLAEVDQFVEEAKHAGGAGGGPVLGRIGGMGWLGGVGRGGHGRVRAQC